MNITKLSEIITEMEGKKQQLSIAQVKEVLACLSDHVYEWVNENGEIQVIEEMFWLNGHRRAQAKAKKRKKRK